MCQLIFFFFIIYIVLFCALYILYKLCALYLYNLYIVFVPYICYYNLANKKGGCNPTKTHNRHQSKKKGSYIIAQVKENEKNKQQGS